MKMKPYFYVKRVLDTLFALILAIPGLVVVGICAIAIKMESNGPVFFIQVRPGLKCKPIKIFKLRTMKVERVSPAGKELTDMERITNTGRVIRKLSLDELPQLFNILKGEMSFIGPRPLLMSYLPLYNEEQMRRHDVLPGISGWAQVNGRNSLSWEDKFRNDVWYVEHQSLRLDFRIFLLTLKSIISRQGINAGQNETMSIFLGDNEKVDT